MRSAPLLRANLALLILVGATATLRITPAAPPTTSAFNPATMLRYDKAASLLENGHLEEALRELSPDPEEVLVIPATLPDSDSKVVGRMPAGTFLYLGGMLTRRAKQTAHQGARELSQALLKTCYDLSRRLKRGSLRETAAERDMRLSVAHKLASLAERTASELHTIP